MLPATRTPEGQPNRCPVCRKAVCIEPSVPPGDAPCPHCGHLLWFAASDGDPPVYVEGEVRRPLHQAGKLMSDLAVWEASQGQFDNAVGHFVESIVYDPGNVTFVQRFHEFLQARHAGKKSNGVLSRFKLLGARVRLRRAVAQKKCKEAVAAGLTVLRTDPSDVQTLMLLANAAAAAGFQECRVYYLKWALGVAPNDREVNRHCNAAVKDQELLRVANEDAARR